MIRSNGFFNFFSTLIVGILTGVLAFTQPAFTGGTQSAPDNTKFSQTPHIQSALAEMAQAGEKPGACYQTGSVEKCAACCRDFMTACIDLVVPLCLQGDPSRNEFRHCLKNKEDRCKSDFNNCAWLCRRVK